MYDNKLRKNTIYNTYDYNNKTRSMLTISLYIIMITVTQFTIKYTTGFLLLYTECYIVIQNILLLLLFA